MGRLFADTTQFDGYQSGDQISDRQWWDVLGVLVVQAGHLDIDYIRQGANNLGARDLLERAFLESEKG